MMVSGRCWRRRRSLTKDHRSPKAERACQISENLKQSKKQAQKQITKVEVRVGWSPDD